MNHGSRRALTCALVVLGGACSAPRQASRLPVPRDPPFSHIYWSPTTGRVGYHMVSTMHVNDGDYPLSKPCTLHVDTLFTRGDLPPGLTGPRRNPGGGWTLAFEGTPRVPGQWLVSVQLALECVGAEYEGIFGMTSYPLVDMTFTVSP